MMELDDDDKAAGEILRSLLSNPKMENAQHFETHSWQDIEGNYHSTEQVIWQIESPKPSTKDFVPSTENVIQHIPVTYVTADNRNLTLASGRTIAKPVTYVLSRNVVAETPKYCTIEGPELKESPKIVFVQEVEATGGNVFDGAGTRVFAVAPELEQPELETKKDETSPAVDKAIVSKSECNQMKDRKLEEGEESPVAKAKIEKKISGNKKPLNKRKTAKMKSKLKTGGKALVKKPKKPLKNIEQEKEEEEEKGKRNLFELTKLENNVEQVMERFKIGCECSDTNCFDGLNPDNVFKHRLNIADLTKAEHDMYLMGVIMASIQNLEETCRHKERIRIRSCYAYQGKRVCLTAFLYLQHVTLYQMKRLRSHLKNHGVSPRIHGNRGRKPANTFSLDIYRRATNFVQSYIEKHCVKTVPNFTTFSSNKIGSNSISGEAKPGKKPNKVKIPNKMTSYHLPPECTKKTVHREYKFFCENLKPSQKVMKYSTFTSFLKKQFPNVKFQKVDARKPEERNQNETENRIPKEDKGVRGSSAEKSIQTVACVPGKNSQDGPPKNGHHPPNGQHVPLASSGNDVQSEFRISNHVLIGNQIYSAQTAQQIYAVHNVV